MTIREIDLPGGENLVEYIITIRSCLLLLHFFSFSSYFSWGAFGCK